MLFRAAAIWLIACLALTLGCGRAEIPQKSAAGKTPKIVFDSLEKDIGTVWKGEPAKFDFTVKNEGGEPLELEIKPGCGCTVANARNMTIPPGKEDHIIATLTTEHYIHRVTKIVNVSSNDPEMTETQLRITADVKPYVDFQPQYTNIRIYKGDEYKQTFTLTSGDDVPLEIKSVKPSLDYLETKLTTDESTGKTRYLLTVTVPATAPPGNLAGNITVETNHPKASVLNLPVYGVILQEITLQPTYVHFGNVTPGEKAERQVSLSKRKGTFKVKKIASDNPRVSVDIESQPGGEGRSYTLKFRYDGKAPAGPLKGEITIYTDDSEQPVLTVRFSGIVGTAQQQQ
ncbi:MAG: hypothetical protein AUJ92_00995 [Armatimonadetes bacterium CG2_30_59_28]|nr:MAG: hypothetical protein AUJ92_00995 [Armatimonadetes bacterium CG2_30_59_28]